MISSFSELFRIVQDYILIVAIVLVIFGWWLARR
jgi:hypothetical protein